MNAHSEKCEHTLPCKWATNCDNFENQRQQLNFLCSTIMSGIVLVRIPKLIFPTNFSSGQVVNLIFVVGTNIFYDKTKILTLEGKMPFGFSFVTNIDTVRVLYIHIRNKIWCYAMKKKTEQLSHTLIYYYIIFL